ncbi:DUF222 domain-containing protein [uncultured Cellulomonas sp.]|uniref:HNH endonuclease signature motif containing protein n=1 Tax=uncultured Cellulomonas sp. TaxID=189682 RepID=UPI0028EE7B87|nr:DUF222 domain-containing protein [uncultured Cellulomonas sp.]
MGSVLAELTAAVDTLAALADPARPNRLQGAVAVDVVREALVLAGRLTAVAARVVPMVEADGWWALEGARSITTWVASTGRVSHGQAGRVVRLGRALRDDLPATAAAVVAGSVSLEAAHTLAAVANTPDRKTALSDPTSGCGEAFLLAHAIKLPVAQVRVLARRWAAAADPAADERGYREASDREHLNLAQTSDGCQLSGFLTTEHGHALAAALTALAGRSADQAGQPAGRRRASALVNLTRLALDGDLTGATGTHRPQITAVVDYATLHRALDRAPGHRSDDTSRGDAGGCDEPGDPAVARPAGVDESGAGGGEPRAAGVLGAPGVDAREAGRPGLPVPGGDTERFAVAELVGTGPVPDTVLARLACDSALTRVVFGPASQVLNVGRTERTYTGPKRRAIIARDRHCRYPGCHAPPALGEIHHTHHWHRDRGTTDVNTGILLCWHHHEIVHDRAIEITHTDGTWHFTDRHGQPLRT